MNFAALIHVLPKNIPTMPPDDFYWEDESGVGELRASVQHDKITTNVFLKE